MSSNGTSGTPTVHDEIDSEHSADGTESNCQDGRHEETLRAVDEHEQDSPGITLIQSVSDAVIAFVSGNATSTPSDENGEEKTLLRSVGEKLMQSAHSVREAVSGSNDSGTAEVGESCTSTALHCAENEDDEKSFVQSVGERIAQSAQSVKEAVTGSPGGNDEGEDKTVLQAVGEKIVQSAKTVKDAVIGDVHIVPGDDETAELSILVHNILD